MDTLEFLRRVLPSAAGGYAAFSAEPRRRHRWCETVEELADTITRADENGDNVYYAISVFRGTNNGQRAPRFERKQGAVALTRVVALDVDCGPGKPYPSWKEGLVAVGGFVTQHHLPRPLVVASGLGLHVYWVLDTDLEPHAWQPLADGLKALMLDSSLRADPAVTADSARVLRAVGTTNRKNGRKARVLLDAPPTSPEALRACLGTSAAAPRRTMAGRPSALTAALEVETDFPPARPALVASGCGQVVAALAHPETVEEPLWYALMGVAAHCEEPEQTALAWSEGHPGFSEAATLAKLEQWRGATTGPATCERFAMIRPDICKACPHYKHITTPVQLGVRSERIVVEAVEDAPEEVPLLELPAPYFRSAEGIRTVVKDIEFAVCPFDIFPESYGRDDTLGYEVVRYRWNRPHKGWQPLVFRQALLNDGNRDFPTAVADQGIVLPNKSHMERFQNMLRAYMDSLRTLQAATDVRAHMGWTEDFSGFVLGDVVIRDRDGTVEQLPTPTAAAVRQMGDDLWVTRGSADAWTKFTRLVSRAELRAHGFAILVALSAPLYALTGLKGLVISLYGPTGGGKTLAQLWAQSVWGNPERLHFAAKFTQNALFSRMGIYRHTLMSIDEVTMMDDREVGDFAYWVSQGRDKARLDKSSVEREAKIWALPVLVSTNRSLATKLVAAGLETDAQLARILELPVPASALFKQDSSAGSAVWNQLHASYGHAGRAFVTWLMERGIDRVREDVRQASKNFRERYNARFAGEERYWEQAIVLADLAGQWAKDMGLIDFEPQESVRWVLSHIGAIRRSVLDSRTDTFDVLAEYLAEHANAQISLWNMDGGRLHLMNMRTNITEVRARFELLRHEPHGPFVDGTVYIDKVHMRRWMAHAGYDWKAFTSNLRAMGLDATPRSGKLMMGRGTHLRLPQIYVLGVSLRHNRLIGLLTDMEASGTGEQTNVIPITRSMGTP